MACGSIRINLFNYLIVFRLSKRIMMCINHLRACLWAVCVFIFSFYVTKKPASSAGLSYLQDKKFHTLIMQTCRMDV